MSRFIQPRLECEIGFVIGRRVKGPNCSIFDVLSATDYVVPCAEIRRRAIAIVSIRRRISRSAYSTTLQTSRQCRSGFWRAADAGPWTSIYAGSQRLLSHNVIEVSGVAAAVLNHPANGVAWLANKLAPFDVGLEPGSS